MELAYMRALEARFSEFESRAGYQFKQVWRNRQTRWIQIPDVVSSTLTTCTKTRGVV